MVPTVGSPPVRLADGAHSDALRPVRYWREPDVWERKLDFAEIERQEALALAGSRVRLGLIVAGVMEKWVAWANERVTSPASLRALPVFMADEFADEMARLMARAYSDGVRAHETALTRMGVEPVRVGLTRTAERYVTEESARWGLATAQMFTERVRPILSAMFVPDGRRTKPLEMVEREIRSLFMGLLDVSETTARWDLAEPQPARKRGRRMKVRDAEQHARWQKEFKPFSPWLREQGEAQAKAIRLKEAQTKRWLQTERTRYFAHGQIAAAQADPSVAQLAYTAIRDDQTCESCVGRDKVVRPKGDNWWALNTPPMHHVCRCSVVPILLVERVRVTPKTALARITDEGVGEGFGTYNPKRVQSAKRLGVSGPTTKAMTRAIRDAAGKNKGARRARTAG